MNAIKSKLKMGKRSALRVVFSCLTITLLLFTSCGGSDAGNDLVSNEYLNVTSQLSLSVDGSQQGTLDIKANCAWQINGKPSWMTLSANSGNGDYTVTISCTPNPSSTDERSCVLEVISASGKIRRSVIVSQPTSTETLESNVEELNFDANGGDMTLSITSNSRWTIQGSDNWFTLSRQEGEGNTDIVVNVAKNESENSRQSVLTIQGSRVTIRVSIKQEGRSTTLTINPTTIEAVAIGSKYLVSIEGDAQWTASSNLEWCELGKSTGIGDAKVEITVKDNTTVNEREAIVTFSTSRNSYNCTIRQAAATLPQVSATTVSNIDKQSMTLSSQCSSQFEIIECGFCYSDSAETPNVNNDVVKCPATSNTFKATLDNLISGRTYFIRAYAISAVGVGYGEVKEVTTTGKPSNNDNPTPEI